MKIAQCTDTFLPITDGVGRVVHAYATGLSSLGHEVTVISPKFYSRRNCHQLKFLETATCPGLFFCQVM